MSFPRAHLQYIQPYTNLRVFRNKESYQECLNGRFSSISHFWRLAATGLTRIVWLQMIAVEVQPAAYKYACVKPNCPGLASWALYGQSKQCSSEHNSPPIITMQFKSRRKPCESQVFVYARMQPRQTLTSLFLPNYLINPWSSIAFAPSRGEDHSVVSIYFQPCLGPRLGL